MRDPLETAPTGGEGAIASDGDGTRANDGDGAAAIDQVGGDAALASALDNLEDPVSSSSARRLAAVVAEACSLLGGADAAADLLQQALESLGLSSSAGGGSPPPPCSSSPEQQTQQQHHHRHHRRHHHHHHHPRHEELQATHSRQRHLLVDSSDGSDGRALLVRAGAGGGGGGLGGGWRRIQGIHGNSGSVSSSDGGDPSSNLLLLSPRPAAGTILHVGSAGGGSGHGGTGLLAEALRTAAATSNGNGNNDSSSGSHLHHSARAARANWQRALAAAVAASRCGGYLEDPWADRKIPQRCPARLALRHRYDAGREQWTVDTVLIKMEDRPFAAGAMRCCLRLKKLSAASRAREAGVKPLDWRSAPNFVAKVFKKPGIPDSAYFDDVKLQMDAKRLCEAYNRSVPPPPKQIDMLSAAVLQIQRPVFTFPPDLDLAGISISKNGTCLIESLVPGEYVKHSSNLGYVDESRRLTPHCFSHFTFEATGGESMVVDIQGVGDVLTDPQIHTADGKGYGDGNLGARGMAAFFLSHECSGLCQRLGLQRFARCHEDADAAAAAASAAAAAAAGTAAAVPGGVASSSSSAATVSPNKTSGEQAVAPLPAAAAAVSSAPPAALSASARARVLSRARTMVPPFAKRGGGSGRGDGSSSSSSSSSSGDDEENDGDDDENGDGERDLDLDLYPSDPPNRATLISALAEAAPSGSPHPHAPLHYAAARLHGETLALAELHTPEAAAAAARAGGFHLRLSAAQGWPPALGAVARGAAGVPPTSALVAGLVKAAAHEERRERQERRTKERKEENDDADDADAEDEDEQGGKKKKRAQDLEAEAEEEAQLALLNDDITAAAAAAAARVGCRAAAAVAAAAAAARGDRSTEEQFLEIASASSSNRKRFLAPSISEGIAAAEEEFQALDGGGRSKAELLAALAEARLAIKKVAAKAKAEAKEGVASSPSPILFGDERTPAQLLEEAAEAAEHEGRGKLAARYYERAAAVEEEEDEEEEEDGGEGNQKE